MRFQLRALIVGCLAAAAVPLAVAGSATVSFVEPDRFGDAGFSPIERQANLQALERHFQSLAQRRLPSDQTLKVEVLDVDLAGVERPSFRAGRDLRILRGGADAPHITLRYTLEGNGRTLGSGEETLSDLNYLRGVVGGDDNEPLRYERRMLDKWFQTRLVERK
jgi:hypothetical protein